MLKSRRSSTQQTGRKTEIKMGLMPNYRNEVKWVSCLGRIAALDAAYCYRRSSVVGRSVCVSVGHDREATKKRLE